MRVFAVAICAGALAFTNSAVAAEWGLETGDAQLRSAGPLEFGPDGILLVGDTKAATVYAIDTADKGERSAGNLNVEDLQQKLAKALKVKSAGVRDLAVHPETGTVYLSVTAGDRPALVRVDASGSLSEMSLNQVPFAKVELPNPPADEVTGEGRRRRNRRSESITDLAYADGKVYVTGLTSGDVGSSIREIPFPFATADSGTPIEFYHGAHGRMEDYPAVQTFVPFNIDGEPVLLAGFTCTPLVRFPVKGLKESQKLRGTTVAELGNRNRPLDMVVYEQNGQTFLLLANSARGLMKISTENIDREEGITERVGGGGTAGQSYETIEEIDGVVQLDKLDDTRAVVIVESGEGLDLRTIDLP